MILAPSHLQPLSGNKLILLSLSLFFLFASCDALKKGPREDKVDTEEKDELDEIQGKTRYNPKTGKYEYVTDVTETLDTVRWTQADPEKTVPPITSSTTRPEVTTTDPAGTPGSEKLDIYQVAMMLPFLTDRFNFLDDKIDERSMLALHYYAGAKIALEELEELGYKMNITIMDTKASESGISNILSRPEIQAANLLIGPIRNNNLSMVASFAKQHRVPMVSPLSPSTQVTSENPYYIQVSPSLVAHCEAITKHVKRDYRTDQVVLVVRNKEAEINRLKYFHEANAVLEGSATADRFRELIINETSADMDDLDLTPFLKPNETTVFIVPSFSNESFIYSFMRKLSIDKGITNSEIVIYGMPQWMDYTRISYDYYEDLNLHVSSSTFIDPFSMETKAFTTEFYNRYNTIPRDEAFKGYDQVKYFLEKLHQNGTQFQNRLDITEGSGLQTSFKFEKVGTPGQDDRLESIDRVENKFVHILKFEDYYFQKAN